MGATGPYGVLDQKDLIKAARAAAPAGAKETIQHGRNGSIDIKEAAPGGSVEVSRDTRGDTTFAAERPAVRAEVSVNRDGDVKGSQVAVTDGNYQPTKENVGKAEATANKALGAALPGKRAPKAGLTLGL